MIASLLCTLALGWNDTPRVDLIEPGIAPTQITATFVHDHTRTLFRATVVARKGPSITILTAAHCLGPAEIGSRIQIFQDKAVASGQVQAVVRNPNYRPAPSGDIPGADNALARIKLDEVGDFPLESLKTAELVNWAVPDPDGELVTIQTIDQFGQPHKVKAGNYTNPRWLEWGPTYRPVPGDSGSGVFIVRTSRGKKNLLLIGSVVDRSQRGGGASVLHLRDRWLREALQAEALIR